MESEISDKVQRIHRYHHRNLGKFRRYLDDIKDVRGGTVSRFAAASLIGVSRQRIHQIIAEGVVQSWEFFEGWPNPTVLSYSEISTLDLLEYAVRMGRDLIQLRDFAYKYTDWSKPVREFFGLDGDDDGEYAPIDQ